MRRYLLDTNAVSDFINGRRGVPARVRDAKRTGAKIGTCFPVLAEMYYGAELSASRDENIALTRAAVGQFAIWPFDHAAAQEYGRIRAALRRSGRPMQRVDLMVAAIALSLGCTVVTSDSDLSAVPGLRVENWAA